MKHITITLSFMALLCLNSFAQETVDINDSALEQALIDLNLDTNGLNGNILKSDAEKVVDLDISNPLHNQRLRNVHSKIKSLAIIEYFPNLRKLVCFGNDLVYIHLSNNSKLTYLNCSDNKITTLDVSNNSKLATLNCVSNELTDIEFGANTNLRNIYCSNNKLESIDLSECTNVRSLDVKNNPNLHMIMVNDKITELPRTWVKDSTTNVVNKTTKKVVEIR